MKRPAYLIQRRKTDFIARVAKGGSGCAPRNPTDAHLEDVACARIR
jgi:hypothetical protein